MPTIVSRLRSRLLRSVVRAILTVSIGGIRLVMAGLEAAESDHVGGRFLGTDDPYLDQVC